MELRSETAWKKAAACDAHAKLTKDEVLRVKFERLRDSWIRIANDAEASTARANCRDKQADRPTLERRAS
ncbi:MAG: hypothetical protein K2Y71_28065 [Xanthobacteraceae bacterium]|nr:hypothetical protein [Xanthobacteraceae bacterium]